MRTILLQQNQFVQSNKVSEIKSLLFTSERMMIAVAIGHYPPLSAISPHQMKTYDLIIIGAGISGLAAAYQAKKHNLSFLVLEARNRIGGRVYSKKLQNGLIVELGGEWLGKTHKEILNFCKNHNIKLEPHRFTTPNYLSKEGKEYTDLDQIFEKFETFLKKLKLKNIPEKTDWYSFLEKKFTEEELKILGHIYGPDFATHIRYVAARDAFTEATTGGNSDHMDYHVRGGNSKIAHTLAKTIGKPQIKLHQIVTKITDNRKTVTITTKTHQFTAKKVLITTATQAFKDIDIYPPMKAKKEIANDLTYGDITKAFLSFSSPLPLKHQNFSTFTETDLQFIFVASQGQSKNKFALCIYSVGPAAKKIHKMSPETLWRKVKKILPKNIFDTTKITPDEIIHQNWGTDPYTEGGYCIFNPNEHTTIKKTLGKPHGNIHFAGDYLGKMFNYINGAFQSGTDQAKKIAKSLKRTP